MVAALIVRSGWRFRSPESLARRHARAVARKFAAPREEAEPVAKIMNDRVAHVSWSGFRSSCSGQLDAWADAEDSPLSAAGHKEIDSPSAAVVDRHTLQNEQLPIPGNRSAFSSADDQKDGSVVAGTAKKKQKVRDTQKGKEAAPLNKSAKEFVPGVLVPDFVQPSAEGAVMLPSIGAQIDFMLQSLMDKVSVLQAGEKLQLVALESRVSSLECFYDKDAKAEVLVSNPVADSCVVDVPVCGLDELHARVGNLEIKINDVGPQVVKAFAIQVPQIITPVVQLRIDATLSQCLATMQDTLSQVFASKQQFMFDCVVKKLQAEFDIGGRPLPSVPTEIKNECGGELKELAERMRDEGEEHVGGSCAQKKVVDGILPPSSAPAKPLPFPAPLQKASPPSSPDAPGNAQMFVVGDAVLIHGLVKSAELNFHSGLIVGYAKDTSRYIVDLIADDTDELSGRTVRVKFDNLLSAADMAADDLFNYSDDSDTNVDESQPSPRLHGDRLGPSCSKTSGRQT